MLTIACVVSTTLSCWVTWVLMVSSLARLKASPRRRKKPRLRRSMTTLSPCSRTGISTFTFRRRCSLCSRSICFCKLSPRLFSFRSVLIRLIVPSRLSQTRTCNESIRQRCVESVTSALSCRTALSTAFAAVRYRSVSSLSAYCRVAISAWLLALRSSVSNLLVARRCRCICCSVSVTLRRVWVDFMTHPMATPSVTESSKKAMRSCPKLHLT